MENQDQVQDTTPNAEQDIEEQSTETEEVASTFPEEEQITPEKAYDLARATQKGFTQTRQEIAEMRRALETITTRPQNEYAPTPQDQEPQTWGEMKQELRKELLGALQQQEETKKEEDLFYKNKVDHELSELQLDGKIKNKDERNELLDYALRHKEDNLINAYAHLAELKEAKKEGIKEGLKGKIQENAASNVGTSQKVSTEESKGISYEEIHGKSIWDF